MQNLSQQPQIWGSERKALLAEQWRIHWGEEPGGPAPLFLDQTEAQRAEKNFLETAPLRCLRVWMTKPPLSQGQDPALQSLFVSSKKKTVSMNHATKKIHT